MYLNVVDDKRTITTDMCRVCPRCNAPAGSCRFSEPFLSLLAICPRLSHDKLFYLRQLRPTRLRTFCLLGGWQFLDTAGCLSSVIRPLIQLAFVFIYVFFAWLLTKFGAFAILRLLPHYVRFL